MEQINLETGILTENTILNPNPVFSAGSSIWGDNIISFGVCSSNFNAQYSKKLYKISPWGEWTELADMHVGLQTKGEVVYDGNFNSKLFETDVANRQSSNISWLVSSPITASSSDQVFLNFETKDGFNNGETLQVYLITNWTGDITTSTKTLLSANIASGSTAGYDANFTFSGNVPLTGDLSNFRIGFKYVGGYAPTPKTTTYQIDNVRVYKAKKF
ncbi:choice-of-anchor J domain-containing protein [Flavobacterium dankookense]|uniref:choice-of-anchor J domain-containing protein n=1 Tax=Flavobacterium dankookense TaxID=706186 RepID=UPI0013C320FF|nr:choice-of-anchor J domain-containing protein [Flavobacterium dankookense]